MPGFIVLFVAAAVIGLLVPALGPLWAFIGKAARLLLTTTLFLIGSTLSRSALASVGARPLLLGLSSWILISLVSLAAVRALF